MGPHPDGTLVAQLSLGTPPIPPHLISSRPIPRTAGEPPDEGEVAPEGMISSFNITGVAAAYARMSKDTARTVLGKPKVSVTFALSSSGLIDVSKAEAAIEMLEKAKA